MRKEFPLVGGPNSKPFGTLSIFTVKAGTFLYAERFKDGKKYAGLSLCKNEAEAETKVNGILSGIKEGQSFFVSKESQAVLAEYQAKKKAAKTEKPKATAKTTAKKPSIVF